MEVPREGIPRKFCVCVVTDRIWHDHLQPNSPIREKGQHGSLLLLTKTTCFMSNLQHKWLFVGLFDSHTLLLYRKLLLVNSHQYYAILWLRNNTHWIWCAFIIRLIPGSPPPYACQLESLGTGLNIFLCAEMSICYIWGEGGGGGRRIKKTIIGRAKQAPHWGVQSRFRVIYICIYVRMSRMSN